MFIRNGLFSSESVSEGHPDKLADRISDAVLDEFLKRDPGARVACETLLADGYVICAGEFRTRREADFEDVRARAASIIRAVLRDAGYRDAATGIDPDCCEIQVRFNRQSADINRGVDREDGVTGAGDQGLMFGYACDETPQLMPAPIIHAHRLMQRQAELRRSGALPWLGPDAKAQVTFRYEAGRPVAVETVVLSTQHDETVAEETLRAAVRSEIIDAVIPSDLRAPKGFPHYRDKPDLLSANLMTALKSRGLFPTPAHRVYSLRHSFEKRMQEAELDYGFRCMIMGHANSRPAYGDGGSMEYRRDQLMKIAPPVPEGWVAALTPR